MSEELNKQEKTNWLPLIAIIASMAMMYITSFSVNVLISPIVEELNWSVSGLQLVIVSASLIAGSLQVTSGRLGDKFGKKKIFLLGSLIYTIGLTIVLLAPNSTIFSIGWAFIWPVGMVMVIPTSVAIIMYFYSGSERAAAFGIYGAVLSVISAVAPLVVGLMANYTGWRLALSLSPIFGVLTIILAMRMPETKKDSSIKIDAVSVLLSVVSFGLFLITTTMGSNYGWLMEKRPLVLGETTISLGGISIVPFLYLISISLLIAFFKRGKGIKLKGGSALLDGEILKDKTFAIGAVLQAILYFLVAAILFSVSVFVQSASGFDSFSTALATLPASAGVAVFSFLTPGLGKKIMPKYLIFSGFAIICIGTLVLINSVTVGGTVMDLLPGMLLFGVGTGVVMAQIATVTMLTIQPKDEGGASGLSETMKEIIGQGFAIAFSGALLFTGVYSNMADEYARIEGVELTKVEHQEIVLELEDRFLSITAEEEEQFIQSLPEKTREAYPEIVTNAAEKSMKTTLMVMLGITALCAFLSLLLPSFKLEE